MEEWIRPSKREKNPKNNKFLILIVVTMSHVLCALCSVLWCFRDLTAASCAASGLYGLGAPSELTILDRLP